MATTVISTIVLLFRWRLLLLVLSYYCSGGDYTVISTIALNVRSKQNVFRVYIYSDCSNTHNELIVSEVKLRASVVNSPRSEDSRLSLGGEKVQSSKVRNP